MARNVGDVALMLDSLTGFDPNDPLTSEAPTRSFVSQLQNDVGSDLQFAYTPDLGGAVSVEQDVRDTTRDALKHFAALGAQITEDNPDFSHAYDAFHSLRSNLLATLHGQMLQAERHRIKDDVVWNIERGIRQTLSELQAAERARGELIHRTAEFFGRYDVLIVPSAPLNPFPIEWSYPRSINGVELETYIDWIAITFMITLTACPTVVMPCGFSDEGLPVGLQLVGPPRSEAKLLALANRIEASVGLAQQLPITPRAGARTTS